MRKLAGAARDPAAALLGVAVLLGVVQTVVLGEVARTAAGTVPYLAALVVLLVAGPVATRVGAGRTATVAAAFGMALAAWVVVAFVRALPAGIGEPSGFYRVKVLVTTPVGDHNTAAGLLLVAVVATVVLAVDDRRWLAGVVMSTVALMATLSRGAAIVLVAAGLVALVVRARRGVAVAVLLAGSVALTGVLTLALLLDATPPEQLSPPDRPHALLPADGDPIGASVTARRELFARGVRVGAANPVLGVGLGKFVDEAQDLPPPNDHAHNLVVHAFAEGGVPLAVVAIGLPVLLARRAWRRQRGDPSGELALIGGAALVAHAQFDVLGGLVGYEVTLAYLLAVADSAPAPEPVADPTG